MSIDLGNKISLLTFSIALAEHFYAVRRLLLPWKFCTVIIAITVINLFLRCCQCTQPLIYVMLALFVELFKDFWAGCCHVLWSVTSQVSTQRYRSRLEQLRHHAWCLLSSIINVRAQTSKRLCTCYELCDMTSDVSTQLLVIVIVIDVYSRCPPPNELHNYCPCDKLTVWRDDRVTTWPCDELTGILLTPKFNAFISVP